MKKEILAYKHLRKAWGVHVPTPAFISASPTGNVRFLGMAKGDDPKRVGWNEAHELQRKLITDYGFRRLDNSHGRNYIIVQGKLMMILISRNGKISKKTTRKSPLITTNKS